MRFVLDTNALLISIAKKSPYRPIFDALIEGKFTLLLTNEILTEYTEVIESKSNSLVASNIAELLVKLKNIDFVNVYFQWNLIAEDDDDNKFVDAFVSGRADYLVTNDRHFNELTQISFPKVNIMKTKQFLALISTL
ncbi:MAG: putative toxin-antitoxin system toxin component, PIN family [Tunicatimonas sp.]|uniref:putative toxin-antitoxin system toxin component, PIN family n=1 Tax=Tunicatimonas sp. TaxID=1940096 RepID=UPI003C744595